MSPRRRQIDVHKPQRSQDNRGQRDRERPSRSEFIWDEKIGERKDQMIEKAKELKAVAPTEVMFAMVGMMEGFSREGNIYAGPTKKDFDEELMRGDSHRKIREVHSTFDFEEGPKNSDWLRTIGVFKAAMNPGNNIPGVFNVKPPQRGVEDKQWNKFANWCKDNYLNPINISRAAHRLANALRIHGRDDIERLSQRLEDITGQDMDQIIIAGFANDPSTLRVEYLGTYHRLQDLERELDPDFQEKEWEERKAFVDGKVNQYFEKVGKKWYKRPGADAKYEREHGRFGDLDLQRIHREADEEWEKEHTWEQTPLISNKSAAFERNVPACIIGLQEKKPPKRGYEHEGPELYAHGVHPVSMEVVKQLVGPDKIVQQDLGLKFDSRTGQVRNYKNNYLIAENGIPLGSESEQVTGEEAREVFAEALAEYTKEPSNLNWEKREKLPFIDANHKIQDRGSLAQLYHRSKGRVGQYIDSLRNTHGENPNMAMDIQEWYEWRLLESGEISTFAEAEDFNDSLMLDYVDLYPEKEGLIEEIDKDFPAKINIKGKAYPVSYFFDEKTGEHRAFINADYRDEDILTMEVEDIPEIGPLDERMEITFNTAIPEGGFSGKYNSVKGVDLPRVQEAIYHKEIDQAWKKVDGPEKTYLKKLDVMPGEPFQSGADLVDIELKPFIKMPNGEEHYPVPGIIYGSPVSLNETGFFVKLFPSNFEMEKDKQVRRAKHIKERRDKEKVGRDAAGPKKIAQAEAIRDGLYAKLEENRKTDIFKIHLSRPVSNLLYEARQCMESGDIDDAMELYEKAERYYEKHIEGRMDRFHEAQKLYEEYKSLFSGPPNLRYPELDENIYFFNKETGEEAKKPPSKEDIEKIIKRLEQEIKVIKERKVSAAAWQAENETKRKRWEGQSEEERQAEIAEMRKEMEEIIKFFDEETKEGRPIRFKFQRSEIWDMRSDYFERRRDDFEDLELDDIRAHDHLLTIMQKEKQQFEKKLEKIRPE